jgi:hypothetical protein
MVAAQTFMIEAFQTGLKRRAMDGGKDGGFQALRSLPALRMAGQPVIIETENYETG